MQAGDFDRRGKTENGSQQRAGRLKRRACYPIFYREQALFAFVGLFNFDSLVGAQSVQNRLDHGKQGSRFVLAAFIDEQAHAANRRAVALRIIVKKLSCVYFKRLKRLAKKVPLIF